MHAHKDTHTHARTHTHLHTHARTHARTHTHTHTKHTHTKHTKHTSTPLPRPAKRTVRQVTTMINEPCTRHLGQTVQRCCPPGPVPAPWRPVAGCRSVSASLWPPPPAWAPPCRDSLKKANIRPFSVRKRPTHSAVFSLKRANTDSAVFSLKEANTQPFSVWKRPTVGRYSLKGANIHSAVTVWKMNTQQWQSETYQRSALTIWKGPSLTRPLQSETETHTIVTVWKRPTLYRYSLKLTYTTVIVWNR